MAANIKELLIEITTVLVDKPEAIEIKELQSEQSMIFELRVDQTDLGKVIGKGGRTAQAIRTLLESACGKMKKRCILEILE
jgi:uncharacterized protein